MQNKYVILDNDTNQITNIVIWSGDINIWQPPKNTTAVPIEEIDLTQYTWKTEGATWETLTGLNNG